MSLKVNWFSWHLQSAEIIVVATLREELLRMLQWQRTTHPFLLKCWKQRKLSQSGFRVTLFGVQASSLLNCHLTGFYPFWYAADLAWELRWIWILFTSWRWGLINTVWLCVGRFPTASTITKCKKEACELTILRTRSKGFCKWLK